MLRRAPVLLAIAFLSAPAHAEGTDWAMAMAEAEWDWHPGDLIFRNGINDQDELLRDAEGGAWASVGILRASSGGPRVVYADQDQGVTEVMLYEFVDGLGPDDYAVYRIDALDPNRPGQQMQMGPIATYALTVAYGAGFDSHMLPDDDMFYNADCPIWPLAAPAWFWPIRSRLSGWAPPVPPFATRCWRIGRPIRFAAHWKQRMIVGKR